MASAFRKSASAPPVAQCQDVNAAANTDCQGNVTAVQVDNGSSDPGGDPIRTAPGRQGPYAAGNTSVTLAVHDSHGASSSCAATVTVVDETAPAIACPADFVATAPAGQSSVVVNFPAPTVTDNCPGATTGCSPPSGSSFPLGSNPVVCTATDAAGNVNSCGFTVTVAPTAAAHDLAVVKMKAPPRITLRRKKPSRIAKATVTIQNRSPHAETIPDSATLSNAVVLSVHSLGACPDPVATVVSPTTFPITLASKSELMVVFHFTIDCANDPAATTKKENHADYSYAAAVHPPRLP